jgi:hypothetical protein
MFTVFNHLLRGIALLTGVIFLGQSTLAVAHVVISPNDIYVAGTSTPITTVANVDTARMVQDRQVFADTHGLTQIDDGDLGTMGGQAGSLLISDTIAPNALTGNTGAGSPTDFTFFRVGLDGVLDFNANMSKLQLGCGGVNSLLTGTPGCDIDIDYLSFMGINATGDAPGVAGSSFSMKRPFVEFAIKNANNPATREVAGFQLGGQSINGALGIGRQYANGQTNLEHGGVCNTATTTGAGVSTCNSGINAVSGNLGLELSAAITAHANVAIYDTTIKACFGRITSPAGGMYGCTSNPSASATDGTAPFFVQASGTRISQLWVAAAKLHIQNINLGCFFLDVVCLGIQGGLNTLVSNGYGQLKIDMRQVHYLVTPNTPNFFLSFQRQPVAWPNYSKTTPPTNVANDICNPASNGSPPASCLSAYAPVANTGWWLNAPGAKILNIEPPQPIELGSVSIGTLLSVFAPEGTLLIDNPKIGLARPSNCYGSSTFC